MLNYIDKWKQKALLQVFTIYLRYLIGGAFVIAAIGMGKLNGTSNLLNSMSEPIQNLQPIQQFFRVMSDSGLYWNFIGWMQILAGALLLTQRFAKAGALAFFGMILNIFIVTISYEFKGTPVITGLMLLASVYLLIWDARSLQFIIRDEGSITRLHLPLMDDRFWMYTGIVMLISIFTFTGLRAYFLVQLLVPFTEGLIAFIFYFLIYRRNRKVTPHVQIQ